jgi:hypothetical protein
MRWLLGSFNQKNAFAKPKKAAILFPTRGIWQANPAVTLGTAAV